MAQPEPLFRPIRIGNMELKNRFVMAPITVDWGNPDETPSDRQIAYYAERAKGGVGLVCVEVTTVDPKHRYQQRSIGLHSDTLIAGHKKLVDAVHAQGAKIQPQISHTGPESLAPFFEGLQPMGPSVIRTETTKQACREITLEEIERCVEMYGDAAVRAREAGYDGIELHAAHSYMLLGSFLSPLRNFRTDEYAGHSFDGRTKLIRQVLANIRAKVGEDFPITVRLSGYEREPGGREINDTQRLGPLLERSGVDAFHVSGGVGDSNITQIITGPEYAPGCNLAAAEALKQVVGVPVMAVGQNMEPDFVRDVVGEGRADMVVLGRALLADPYFPRKMEEGREREINRCILCQDCVDVMTTVNNGTACAINPRTGREAEFSDAPAAQPKKVLVIGGGPGGLSAALRASERGHHVTLVEREGHLGGRFRRAAATFPWNRRFLDHLVDCVSDAPIEVKLGEEVTEASVKELAPDVVIVATGGGVELPDIPGADGPNVVLGAAVHELVAVEGEPPPGEVRSPVVVIGGHLIGLELAEYFARQGNRVRVLEPTTRLAMPAGKKRRGDHAKRLDELGVPVNTGVAITGITIEGVVLDLGNGRQHLVEAHTVLIPGEIVADGSLAERLEPLVAELRSVGDCAGFGLTKKAVADASAAVETL